MTLDARRRHVFQEPEQVRAPVKAHEGKVAGIEPQKKARVAIGRVALRADLDTDERPFL